MIEAVFGQPSVDIAFVSAVKYGSTLVRVPRDAVLVTTYEYRVMIFRVLIERLVVHKVINKPLFEQIGIQAAHIDVRFGKHKRFFLLLLFSVCMTEPLLTPRSICTACG